MTVIALQIQPDGTIIFWKLVLVRNIWLFSWFGRSVVFDYTFYLLFILVVYPYFLYFAGTGATLGMVQCVLSKQPNRHYSDVRMGAIASQITSLTIVYSTVYSDADQRKYQSSASLAFVWGIHRGPVNSPHKGPVTRKMFPFDDVIMGTAKICAYFMVYNVLPRPWLVITRCYIYVNMEWEGFYHVVMFQLFI